MCAPRVCYFKLLAVCLLSPRAASAGSCAPACVHARLLTLPHPDGAACLCVAAACSIPAYGRRPGCMPCVWTQPLVACPRSCFRPLSCRQAVRLACGLGRSLWLCRLFTFLSALPPSRAPHTLHAHALSTSRILLNLPLHAHAPRLLTVWRPCCPAPSRLAAGHLRAAPQVGDGVCLSLPGAGLLLVRMRGTHVHARGGARRAGSFSTPQLRSCS